ncbi:MAG: flagellar hook-basal body complex protein FliE [Clostridiales bacterium]|jgi:flagellar hook-basal body complex protein FliE|nr:flagellar hook-basal body complex protein FliE [Clostridiales bacterium]
MSIPAISSLGNVTAVQPNAQSIIDAANFLRPPAGVVQADEGQGAQSFETMLSAFMDMVNSAGAMEARAQNLQIEYAMGNHDDMLAVILAQEAAYTSLFFTVQVTNRIIQAYQEIMRMQV